MAVDEFSIKKGHKYATIVVLLDIKKSLVCKGQAMQALLIVLRDIALKLLLTMKRMMIMMKKVIFS